MSEPNDFYCAELWQLLVEDCICTDDELTLITSINGYSKKTLEAALTARTGHQTMEAYTDEKQYKYHYRND